MITAGNDRVELFILATNVLSLQVAVNIIVYKPISHSLTVAENSSSFVQRTQSFVKQTVSLVQYALSFVKKLYYLEV